MLCDLLQKSEEAENFRVAVAALFLCIFGKVHEYISTKQNSEFKRRAGNMEKFLTTYEKSFFDRAEKSVGAEINLQEYLPGAVKIIKVRAVGVAEETEVQKDGIFIRGCVRFSAVYRSDFRDRLKCAVYAFLIDKRGEIGLVYDRDPCAARA